MKIIALDPGYDRCGVAIIERKKSGSEVLLESACITTDREDLFEKRLLELVQAFRKLTKKHKPDVCVLETLFFTTNQKTAMRVAEARGALIFSVTELGVPVHEFTPKQVKIAVTGDGSATKGQVKDMLMRLITVDKKIQYDDEYDAIAVGLTASASLRSILGENNYPHHK